MNNKWIRNLIIIMLILGITLGSYPVMAATNPKIYDYAKLLTTEELEELEQLSNQYSDKRQVDIILLTVDDNGGLDIEEYTENFYDEMGLGYDKSHGNTVMLTIDLDQRDMYMAGFYKGEEYLDNHRLDLIREKITSDLSGEYYFEAFRSYIELSNQYMGITPGVNPENILLQLWFQILASIGIAGIIVMIMLYRSSGRMTTSGANYMDADRSGVTARRDNFMKTDISKVKKPTNNNNSSGGGGGVTKSGHSHSGSRGKF